MFLIRPQYRNLFQFILRVLCVSVVNSIGRVHFTCQIQLLNPQTPPNLATIQVTID
ncbi:hypothetical protein CKA32_001655 [Geitlerinema sp. FC II]|nr:hypothetical protein CKA32_001655 [Geitlerinema sp. FC II]